MSDKILDIKAGEDEAIITYNGDLRISRKALLGGKAADIAKQMADAITAQLTKEGAAEIEEVAKALKAADEAKASGEPSVEEIIDAAKAKK